MHPAWEICISVTKQKEMESIPIFHFVWGELNSTQIERKGESIMTEKKIKLNATNEVQEFVKAASECNFDINLHYQRAIVDAKSFLGVLSLGLSKILTVSYGGNDGNFEQILSKYAVA